jgi:hypothetical protein
MAKSKPQNVVTHSNAEELLSAIGIVCGEGKTIPVQRTVSLFGTISKGEASKADATVKGLSLNVVGCILRHCGATRQAALDAAMAAIKAASVEDFEPDPIDVQWATAFKARIGAELPQIEVSGRMSGSLMVLDVTADVPIKGHVTLDLPKAQVPA